MFVAYAVTPHYKLHAIGMSRRPQPSSVFFSVDKPNVEYDRCFDTALHRPLSIALDG